MLLLLLCPFDEGEIVMEWFFCGWYFALYSWFVSDDEAAFRFVSDNLRKSCFGRNEIKRRKRKKNYYYYDYDYDTLCNMEMIYVFILREIKNLCLSSLLRSLHHSE
jgi:hypothetical protein